MIDEAKTKEQLIAELRQVRRRMDELQAAETRAKQAEEEELKLHTQLLDSAADSILLHGLDGNFLYANRVAYESRGYTKDEFMSLKLHLLIPPGLRGQIEEDVKNILERKEHSFELLNVRKDGSTFLIESHSRIIEHNGKKLILGVHRDITERKQMEEQLKKTVDELERFTYTVSHDLKSPLVTIKTFLSYLQQDISRSDAMRIESDMRYLHSAASKMAKLLDELLEMSRIGRLVNPPVPVTFKELVNETLDLVAGRISEKGVEVQVCDDNITLYGDRPRLLEIWQNLIDNAVKFMGDQASPRIEVGFEGHGRDTVFFVRDNGGGIDPRYHSKLFRLFEKLNPKIEGTGLGLALIKRIVELYHGTIEAESAGPGQGTCFRFTLPDAIK